MKDILKYIFENGDKMGAIIGSLTGLIVGLCSAYWAYRSKKSDDHIKLKELAIKEEQFKEEKKYQISREKYQKIFEDKIAVYKKLSVCLNQLDSELMLVGHLKSVMDSDGEEDLKPRKEEKIQIESLQKIFKTIEENMFVISNNVLSRYRDLKKYYIEHTEEIMDLYLVGAYDSMDAYGHLDKKHREYYRIHKDHIKCLYESIIYETDQIKKDIGIY